MSSLDASKSAATIADYDAVAAAFDAGNKDHDVSQNIDALLEPTRWHRGATNHCRLGVRRRPRSRRTHGTRLRGVGRRREPRIL